mmetsp:Transcript_7148/g.25491  ORF Transcript_7148/g.25491 Transcript_7148/m.25491 type:complete len:242 (-) Transcript_7148:189-914(-)
MITVAWAVRALARDAGERLEAFTLARFAVANARVGALEDRVVRVVVSGGHLVHPRRPRLARPLRAVGASEPAEARARCVGVARAACHTAQVWALRTHAGGQQHHRPKRDQCERKMRSRRHRPTNRAGGGRRARAGSPDNEPPAPRREGDVRTMATHIARPAAAAAAAASQSRGRHRRRGREPGSARRPLALACRRARQRTAPRMTSHEQRDRPSPRDAVHVSPSAAGRPPAPRTCRAADRL